MACIRKRRGKWVADWRDGGGRRRWQAFETKREAEDFLDQERPRTRQRMICAVEPLVTVQEYGKRWLGLIEAVVKPGTYRRYEQLLNRHILPSLGSIPIRHIHKGVIKDFLAEKLSQPVKIQNPSLAEADQKEKQLARNSVRNLHAILRAMLRAAVDDGLLLTNPAEKLGRQLRLVTSKTTRQEAVKALTREQRHTFLSSVLAHEPRFFALLFTLAGTGMRLGEALALQWPDLDLVRRKIRVERAFSDGSLNTPKSGHGRTVDISKILADVLAQWKTVGGERRESDRPPWVFVSEAGTLLDGANVRKIMMRILKKANLPLHLTPHCLRHTYAS